MKKWSLLFKYLYNFILLNNDTFCYVRNGHYCLFAFVCLSISSKKGQKILIEFKFDIYIYFIFSVLLKVKYPSSLFLRKKKLWNTVFLDYFGNMQCFIQKQPLTMMTFAGDISLNTALQGPLSSVGGALVDPLCLIFYLQNNSYLTMFYIYSTWTDLNSFYLNLDSQQMKWKEW